MATITVPLTPDLEAFIADEIAEGTSESKAHVVRYALKRLREERALARLREAEEDIKAGRVYKGDVLKLIEQI